MDNTDRTASLMTPSKLAQVSRDKLPATSNAWLNQMASDAGHTHLSRLAELEGVLRSHARTRQYVPLGSDIDGLVAALPDVDFGLLEPVGWWARATGKGLSAGAEFAARFADADKAARQLAARTHGLTQKQGSETGITDRTLVEFDVELQAIDKIVEQGGRWLDDMRSQLDARQHEAADEAARQQLRDDTLRCDILTTRLKLLRGVSAAAGQARDCAVLAATRRSDFLEMIRQALDSDVAAWQEQLSTLATRASREKSPTLDIAAATESHRGLALCMKQAASDFTELQEAEKALANSLVMLKAQLEAVH